MKLTIALAGVLALAACAPYAADRRTPEVRAADIQRNIATLAREPLDAFLAEPRGSCDSSNLKLARFHAEQVNGGRFELASLSAGLQLDVADAAAAHGCPDFARGVYREVIATYIGWGYAAHRQRAEVGLAELRAGG